MKRNEGPQGQNERKWRGKRWQCKKVVGGPLQEWPLRRETKFFVREIGKTGHFWQLIGGAPEAGHQKAKMQGNQGPKSQNARKWRPKRPKEKNQSPKQLNWKGRNAEETKITGNEGPEAKITGNEAQKAGNEGLQSQKERKGWPTRAK